MLATISDTLGALRRSVSHRIERAYDERDSAEDEVEMAYAEGKAEALSAVETDVIRAERARSGKPGGWVLGAVGGPRDEVGRDA
ncbi:hypothetical protein HJD18_01915 [Thermoleophilia bacterium SCSIO 60948]|nr:hypothetical protein HJD18_01915 [Thermoleophilia bacterium SCSIO 60948]